MAAVEEEVVESVTEASAALSLAARRSIRRTWSSLSRDCARIGSFAHLVTSKLLTATSRRLV